MQHGAVEEGQLEEGLNPGHLRAVGSGEMLQLPELQAPLPRPQSRLLPVVLLNVQCHDLRRPWRMGDVRTSARSILTRIHLQTANVPEGHGHQALCSVKTNSV